MEKGIKKKGLIIFDMDGTLYNFKEGSFSQSGLKKKVLENARLYIARKLNKSISEAESILGDIRNKYGEEISVALEKEFGIDRNAYFNGTWNISAEGIVNKNPLLRDFLLKLKTKYDCVLVSDAPAVWINNVLKKLNIGDIFAGSIYSGEGKIRKGLGKSFEFVARELMFEPENCIVVGDQEDTDIIQAKKNGMTAVLVSVQKKEATEADFIVKDVFELRKILKL